MKPRVKKEMSTDEAIKLLKDYSDFIGEAFRALLNERTKLHKTIETLEAQIAKMDAYLRTGR
jgi:prefoldin subunit 5